MADERKVQLGVEVDASGARKGFDEVKQGARDMAQSVAQAGTQAGKGLDNVGTGGDQAAQKLDRATKSIISSIQRTTAVMEAGSKGTSEYYAAIAAQRGVSADALRPYLAQLDAAVEKQAKARQSLNGMGVSAGQTAAALRGVPAQFTDIFTSLASGQAPLTVFLQQGGQLKDMFGGSGAAARALGGYVAGLVGPLTIAAVAAGGLAVAWAQGDAEAAEYRKTLALTGNQAGTTADELGAIAEKISAVSGTQSAAAEVLTQLAGSGRVAAAQMESVGGAIAAMAAVTGRSVEDLVKQFAELGKDPVKAIQSLNESYNFLTPAIYDQIRALEEQGHHEEAVALAQETAARALKERAEQVRDSAGVMEQAWSGVRAAAVGAWDAMKNVGRETSAYERLADARAKAQSGGGFLDRLGGLLSGETFDPTGAVKAIEAEIAAKEKAAKADADRAKSMRDYAEVQKGVIDIQKKGADQTKTLADALKDYRASLDKIRAANPNDSLLDPAKVAAGEAAIRKQYESTNKLSAGQRAAATEAKRLHAAMLEGAGLTGDFLAEWDRLSKLFASGAFGQGAQAVEALATAQARLLEKQPAIREAAKAAAEAEKQAAKAAEDRANALRAIVEAEAGRANTLGGHVEKMREELQTLGMSSQQLAAYEAGKLAAAAAAEELAASNLEEAASTGEAAGASAEAVAHYLGLAAARREAAQALRAQADLTLEKAQKQATIDAADAAEKEWKRTADSIEQSLTDALMRGFENGEDFGENLRQSLINMFKTLVLRPIIQPIAQGMSNMVLQAVGMGGGGGAAGGGAGGMNLQSLMQNGSSLYNYGSIASQYFGGTMSGANALGTAYANATGTGLDGLVGATGGWGTAPASAGVGTYAAGLGGAMWAYNKTGSYTAGVAGGAAGMAASGAIAGGVGAAAAGTSVAGGAASGAMGAAGLGAIPGWGWAALAVMAIAADMLQKKEDPEVAYQMAKKGGQYDKNWEDGVKVTSVFGELGLNWNSQDVDAKDYRKQLEALAAFDGAMAAFLDQREIDAVRERMDGWKSKRINAKYAAAGQRERLLAITEGIGGDVYADAQAFIDSGKAKGNKGVKEFTQFVIDRIRTDELSDLVGTLGTSLDEDSAMTWMQSLNRTETIKDEKGKNKKVEISGFNEIAGATQQLAAVIGPDSGSALAMQVKAVAEQFDGLGQAMPSTADGFRELVAGIDLTTQAGRDLWMQLGPLAEGFGAVMAAQQQLYDMLVPETEKLATAQAELTKEFGDLSQAVPSSAADLRALIDAQDLSTDAGRAMRAELLALVPAFLGVQGAADQAAAAAAQVAAAIAQEREGLMRKWWTLTGDTTSLRSAELATLHESNRALQEMIWAREDEIDAQRAAQEAAEAAAAAAQALRDAWAALADAITDEVRRLRGMMAIDPDASYAALQTQFAITTAQARAGSQDAAGQLPDLSRALSDMAANMAGSAEDLARMQGATAASLEETVRLLARFSPTVAAALPTFTVGGYSVPASSPFTIGPHTPAFADGGYHTGGVRLVGEAGPELEVTGPSRIWSAEQTRALLSGGSQEAVVREIRRLNDKIDTLEAAMIATARNTHGTHKLLERFDGDGLPETRVAA